MNRQRFYLERPIPIDALPATVTLGQNRLGGLLILSFVGLWETVALWIVIRGALSGKPLAEWWPVLLFPLFGFVFIVAGLNELKRRQTLTIDRESVTLERKGLFGTRSWREEIAAYEGILRRETTVTSAGSDDGHSTVTAIWLHHRDESRCTVLYATRDWVSARAYWEKAARLFGKPALEETPSGLAARELADLNKTVVQLLAEQRLDPGEFCPDKKPAGLALTPVADGLRVTMLERQVRLWAVLLILLFPGFFIWLGMAKKVPVIFPVVGALFALLVVAVFVWDRITLRQLELREDRVDTFYTTPWGEVFRQSLPTAGIETVVARRNRQGQCALAIESDQGQLETGEGLKPEALEWLRGLVLHSLRLGAQRQAAA